jgi:hypothetical protein
MEAQGGYLSVLQEWNLPGKVQSRKGMHGYGSLLLNNNTTTWCSCSQAVNYSSDCQVAPGITACHSQQ